MFGAVLIPGPRPVARMTTVAAVVLALHFSTGRAAVPDGFADLVDQVKPAVVNIASLEKRAHTEGGGREIEIPPELRGTPFEDFLRRYFDQRRGRGDEQHSGSAVALGSGFIIDAAGYVVTNNHLIQTASKIQVGLTDGRKLPARIVGRDEKTDLALLKVDATEPLPFVSWGDSENARVGDWVVAIGNPFGLGGSVTVGVISARGRDIQSGPLDDYLQIDAPINQGNSGGPSFDRTGKVIGINTAIFSPSGGSVGIGFAVPSSEARPVIEALRERGRIDRGWLGVSLQSITKEIADSLGLDSEKGALIADVIANSPAAKAGLLQGDVIRTIDGRPVGETREVVRLVSDAGPDRSLALGIWRDRKEVSVTVKLGRAQEEQKQSREPSQPERRQPATPSSSVLGLSLAPLTREARERLKLSEDTKGVLVTDVKAESVAAEAGLAPGDVVVKVGEKPVATPQDVTDAIQAASDRNSVLLLVARGGNQRFVGISPNLAGGRGREQ